MGAESHFAPRPLVVERFEAETEDDFVAALLPAPRADSPLEVRQLIAGVRASWRPVEPRIKILEEVCAAWNEAAAREAVFSGQEDGTRAVVGALIQAADAAETAGENDLGECIDLLQMLWGIGATAAVVSALQRIADTCREALARGPVDAETPS